MEHKHYIRLKKENLIAIKMVLEEKIKEYDICPDASHCTNALAHDWLYNLCISHEKISAQLQRMIEAVEKRRKHAEKKNETLNS